MSSPLVFNWNGFKGVLFGATSESRGPLVTVITVSLKTLCWGCFGFFFFIDIKLIFSSLSAKHRFDNRAASSLFKNLQRVLELKG